MNTTLFPFDNSYSRLPDYFYSRVNPQPVKQPQLIRLNEVLAVELNLNPGELKQGQGVAAFAGNHIPARAEPLAMVYTGHQFGHFNPQLGDGRAILLGELIDKQNQRFDVQLKGSGRTPYSRGGDGRAALGPVLREYIMCEFMHAAGIPTTRALAAVTTGENVIRDRILPGAILTRLSQSYVRVGTFQFFAARGHYQAVQELADYVIARNYPELRDSDTPYPDLLAAVIKRQAKLIAQWMQIGFIHGVMNTDNASVAGETIDYGPCAFMDSYHPDTVYSSIDQQGRYAYRNQSAIAHWNLCRFAETLVPLLAEDNDAAVEIAQQAINTYPDIYQSAWLTGMRAKLGLSRGVEEDETLINDLLSIMADNKADFTLTFRTLSELSTTPDSKDENLLALFNNPDVLRDWLAKWRERLSKETQTGNERRRAMQAVNLLYIPRNHLVEAVIRAAEDHQEFRPFHELTELLQSPFTQQPVDKKYTLPPLPEQVVHQTFCGT
ncbi:MAG: YdiU family protein [Thiolinea sp.]